MGNVADRFAELGLCRICALPLPREPKDDICSRRCSGLRKICAEVLGVDQATWRAKILAELACLKPATTICPGELSLRLLPKIEKPLTVFRPLLYQMAEEGRIILSQKNIKTPWWKIRGPFRVRKS